MSVSLRKKSLLVWNHWVKPLIVVIFLTFSFRSAVAELNVVPTGSMKPSIVEGDRIWVNKLAYDWRFPFTNESITRWADPQRGDVVVFF